MKTKSEYKTIGTPSDSQDIQLIHVDRLKPIAAQRMTRLKRVDQYLKECGGFDYNQVGVISVVEFPNGDIGVGDGLHRVEMARRCNVQYLQCSVRKVSNQAEAAKLFYRANGVASKKVNNEELFVAKVIAKEPKAITMNGILQSLNLKVIGNAKTGSYAGSCIGRVTKINKFETLYNRYPGLTTDAVNIVNYVWTNFSENLSATLLSGVVYLLNKVSKEVSKNVYLSFCDFLKLCLSVHVKSNPNLFDQSYFTFPGYRLDGYYGASVAYCLYVHVYYEWIKKHRKGQGRRLKIKTGEYPISKSMMENDYTNIKKRR